MRLSKKVFLVASIAAVAGVSAFAVLDESYTFHPDNAPIQYSTAPVNEPVSLLAEKLKRHEVNLAFDPITGYLPALLKILNIPVSSQLMVFSKTSFQAPHIFPRNPRALYFNDSIAVGYVRGGEVLELTSVDPQLGVVFYSLDQERVHTPQIQRRGECDQCHLGPQTIGVPGLVVSSVTPDRNGAALFEGGRFLTDHRSPIKQRWGGWYVTGTHGSQVHMGNTYSGAPWGDSPDAKFNLKDLRSKFDTSVHLTPYSDIVALMVLEHQTRMTNLVTRLNWGTRSALYKTTGQLDDSVRKEIENDGEELVRYMLFSGEFPLEGAIKGSSGFSKEFMTRGPFDHRGRSLRDLDLTRRMFQFPCSFLIYSEAFDGLPDPAKQYVYRRLWEVLTGKDQTKEFAHLSAADRQAILEILLDTKKELPAYWRQEPSRFDR